MAIHNNESGSLRAGARRVVFGILVACLLALLGLTATLWEWRTGRRVWPWSAYSLCGRTAPGELPETVHIGLYEEFPVPWRLNKLELVDFPVTLAVAATTRVEFLELQAEILATYPQVQEVYFWPLLSEEEGYYPGAWSDWRGVQRVAEETAGLPVLWDLEMPLGQVELEYANWRHNRGYVAEWLSAREEPVHIWRAYRSMGLNARFLNWVGMHYDPLKYPAVTLQLDMYMVGEGLESAETERIMRCGVERYGERFVPSLGVLDDGEGPGHIFVPEETLRRNLELAREAGVAEVWLFGVNGLNTEYLRVVREALPLETLSGE